MKHFVVGLGEVGKAVQQVFACKGADKGSHTRSSCDILHICFPYSKAFVKQVRKYIAHYSPKYTVVHSTVPMGTCERLGVNHAPVRGKHPRLVESLKTFVMFVGGPNAKRLKVEFEKFGITCQTTSSPKDTEALKLWDNTQYGLMIMIMNAIHEFCEKHSVDFNTVYTSANATYKKGYEQLGMQQVARPILNVPEGGIGPIGGHCVIPTATILAYEHNEPLAELVVVMDWLLRKGKSIQDFGIKTF